ncbi:MAG: universal stress protein [Gemmatimonadaceae bacterium]
MTGPVVVTLDGRAASDVALAAASQLVRASRLRVLSVMRLPQLVLTDLGSSRSPESLEQLRHLVRAQIRRVRGEVPEVRLDLRSGPAPAAIAAFAEACNASMLVVGLGQSNVRDRLLSEESAFHIARLSTMPVLGVGERGMAPPVRVVVAMDGSPASRRVAVLAREIAAPDARISLIHVRAPAAPAMSPGSLEGQAESLQRGHLGHVEAVHLEGDPATELLAFASEHATDLLAIGRRVNQARPRGVMGTVATRVIRCTPCSFLTVSG